MKHLAIFLSLLSCGEIMAQCSAVPDAGADIHYCQGDPPPPIDASIGGESESFKWTPTTGLSDPNSLNPTVLNIVGNRKYKLYATGWDGTNLIPNGDLEQGNTGFTSGLTFSPTSLVADGTYTVTNDLTSLTPAFSDCGDHTSGSGNMLIAHFSTTSAYIYKSTAAVKPGRRYRFSYWRMNPVLPDVSNVAIPVLEINGKVVDYYNLDVFNSCEWVQWKTTLVAASSTMTFRLYPLPPKPFSSTFNGFGAFDDFELVEECEAVDSMRVVFHPKVVKNISAAVCEGASYQVGNDFFDTDGDFEVLLQTDFGCDSTVKLKLKTIKLPTDISPADPAMTCTGPKLFLSGPSAGGLAPFLTYQWTASGGGSISGNPSAPNIFAASSGTYKLMLKYTGNGLNCLDSASVFVAPPAAPVASAGPPKKIDCDNPTVKMAGSYPGSQTATTVWTTPNGNILSGDSTLTPTVASTGIYILTITSPANGCTDADSVLVSVSPDVPFASAGSPATLDCAAPTVTLHGSASTGPDFEFNWTTADGHFLSDQTTLSPLVDQPGQYFLTVVNKKTGCIGSSSVTIPQDVSVPDAQVGQPFTLTCSTPSAPILGNSTSGFPPIWTTVGGHFVGSTDTFQPTIDEAGIYFLKIVNPVNHCESTVSVEISKDDSPPILSIDPAGPLTCASPTAELIPKISNAGAAWDTYWTTANGSILTDALSSYPIVSAAGDYFLTVVKMNGCSATAQVTVAADPNVPIFSIAPPARLNCWNPTVILSASGGNFTYNWTTDDGQILSGASTASPTVGAAGTYSLIVTSLANGCTAISSVVVEKSEPPVTDIIFTEDPTCYGQNNGSAHATGVTHFNFLWSNGETGPSALNLPAGPVSVTVTDAEGCTATASAELSQPPLLTVSANPTSQTSINQNDGTATAIVAGGTASYTFIWSNGQTTESIDSLAPGQYSVTATDANGCSASATTVVGVAPCQISLDGTAADALCHGSADGSVSIQALHESGTVNFLWSNGQTSQQISGLAAGNYTVTATDELGCSFSTTFTIGQPAPLTATLSHGDVQCPADLTGWAAIDPSGGTAGYTFLWENDFTTPAVSGLGAGIYAVEVTDAHGCSASFSVEIKSKDLLSPVVLLKNLVIPIDANGKAVLGPKQFDDGSTDNCGIVKWTIEPPFFDCEQLGPHDVTVTATDGAGNSTSATAQATVVDEMPPVLTCPVDREAWWCSPTVAYPYPVALDNCLLLGGQFEFLGGLTSGSVFPVGKTVNTWKYTDASGNFSTCTFSVTVHKEPTLLVNMYQPSCHGLCDGSLFMLAAGGTGPFTYFWSSSQVPQTLSNVCSGLFDLSVYDGGSCLLDTTVSLPEPAAISLSNPLISNDLGGAGIGSITVSVAGGAGGYSFEWTKNGLPFSISQNLAGLKTGEYVLKITDSNGCVFTSQKFFVDNLSSAAEPDWAAGMSLLPNPTDGRAELLFHEKLGKEIHVEAFEATGRLVETFRFGGGQTRCQLDFGEQAAGVYLLRILVGDGVAVRRLVRQ